MVQNLLFTSEPCCVPSVNIQDETIADNDEMNNVSEIDKKKKLFDKIFKSERKIVSSKSFNCLSDSTEFEDATNIKINDSFYNNKNIINGIFRKSESMNEIFYLKKSIKRNALEVQLNRNRAISTSKIEKCVRFNDNIKIHELNDDDDRRPMPLAKMYYKDQVELNQLREEMKQIQYRIMNKIEGKVLLDS